MIPTLKLLQPKVHEEVMSLMSGPSILADPVVVTSTNVNFKVHRFQSSGTWTKASNNGFVIIFAWTGGCGGGSGYRAASGGVSTGRGGGGGAPGNAMVLMLPSYYFDTSTAITVGAGGAGGPAQATAGSDGTDGSVGGTTSIGSIIVPQTGTGGKRGSSSAWAQAPGGTGGMSTYIMSGGYVTPAGTQTGGYAASTTQGPLARVPDSTTIGAGTVRMPCLPFCVATGGGGSMIGTGITSYPSNGGDINLFGTGISLGGEGAAFLPLSAFAQVVANNGTYWAYPYGGYANNGQAMMFVTGGTGGGGAGPQIAGRVNQRGGNGGIGAGGAGGAPAGGNGGASSSGPGGNGGNGLVMIYEFA